MERKTRKHRQYTIEEKNEIITMYLSGQTQGISELSKNLDVTLSMIQRWIKQHQQFGRTVNRRGSFTLRLSIVETNRPYIISYNTVQYDNHTPSVLFELFGGSILGLSGHDITPDDYTIDGSSYLLAHLSSIHISHQILIKLHLV